MLKVEERENAILASAAAHIDLGAEREKLLARLSRSLTVLKELGRQMLSARKDPKIVALLRTGQEVILKTIALGQENERARLLRGLVPSKHLPSPHRDRPHFVAELYRRNG